MLCSTCIKLAYQNTVKKCLRCSGQIIKSIAVLCDLCSNSSKQCAACLKKINSLTASKPRRGGCGSCRK